MRKWEREDCNPGKRQCHDGGRWQLILLGRVALTYAFSNPLSQHLEKKPMEKDTGVV